LGVVSANRGEREGKGGKLRESKRASMTLENGKTHK